MNRRRWMRWGAVGAVAAVALSGCVGEDEPEPSESPTGTVSEPAPSEDVASEAQQVYESYLVEAGAMYVEGDDDYTRLLDLATTQMATREASGVADFVENGITVSSWYSLTAFEVSTIDDLGVEVAACVDVDSVRLTGPGGEDVTPADREPLVPLSLRFEQTEDATLLLDAQDPWNPDEESPCAVSP